MIGEETLYLTQCEQSIGLPVQAWRWWDETFRRCCGIKPLDPEEEHLLCIAERRYLGRPFTVGDVKVRRFDPIMEIHLNNARLTKIIAEGQPLPGTVVLLLRETRRAMQALAKRISSDPYHQARVIYGLTLVHRGAKRLGFEVLPIQNRWLARFYTWYLFNLLRCFNPDAARGIDTRLRPVAKRVAMPTDRLIQYYGRCLTDPSISEETNPIVTCNALGDV